MASLALVENPDSLVLNLKTVWSVTISSEDDAKRLTMLAELLNTVVTANAKAREEATQS